MRTRWGRILRMLFLTMLVLALFANAALADRERGEDRETPRVEAAKDSVAEAAPEPEQRQVVLHRPGKPGKKIGKWSTGTKSFTNDCSGWCDNTICVCEEDWWDPGCCEWSCEVCWLIIDSM